MSSDTDKGYESAIKKFESIIDWKDSRNKIVACNKGLEKLRIAAEKAKDERIKQCVKTTKEWDKQLQTLKERLSQLSIFSVREKKEIQSQIEKLLLNKPTIQFGKYYQTNSTKEETIEWRVLAKEGNKILIISEYALDSQQYNTEDTDVTWETCTLRKWMNNDFLNTAFSAEEQKQIQTTKVTADANPEYPTNPGNDTNDKMFLLSITEANKYFSSYEDRKCVPTKYAISNGALTSDSYTKNGEATCWWWLRSPGNNADNASNVNNDGGVNNNGNNVNNSNDCVRPALLSMVRNQAVSSAVSTESKGIGFALAEYSAGKYMSVAGAYAA